jgi:hypothetical protein
MCTAYSQYKTCKQQYLRDPFFLLIKHAAILDRLKRENRGGPDTYLVDLVVSVVDQGRDEGSRAFVALRHRERRRFLAAGPATLAGAPPDRTDAWQAKGGAGGAPMAGDRRI